MPDSMRYRLTDDRERRLDQLYTHLDDQLPNQRWKADVLDMALRHLLESLENAEDMDLGDVPPDTAKQFQTSVIRYRYRTSVEPRCP